MASHGTGRRGADIHTYVLKLFRQASKQARPTYFSSACLSAYSTCRERGPDCPCAPPRVRRELPVAGCDTLTDKQPSGHPRVSRSFQPAEPPPVSPFLSFPFLSFPFLFSASPFPSLGACKLRKCWAELGCALPRSRSRSRSPHCSCCCCCCRCRCWPRVRACVRTYLSQLRPASSGNEMRDL
ncbi:hypothetical protein BKA81DRAFT_24597 [Phyllosticta paracitricarpa]